MTIKIFVDQKFKKRLNRTSKPMSIMKKQGITIYKFYAFLLSY